MTANDFLIATHKHICDTLTQGQRFNEWLQLGLRWYYNDNLPDAFLK